MDKTMLELLIRLLSGQQNFNSIFTGQLSQNQPNIYTNPSYKNFPHEAFVQSVNANTHNNSASGMQDNNMLSLFLSLLGKNNSSFSPIFEMLSKKSISDTKEDNQTLENSSPINDEILL